MDCNGTGETLRALRVTDQSTELTPLIAEAELQQQLITRIRETIGAIICYKDTVILARLPKSRSGKTLRKNLAPLIRPF
jgi:acyl-coenzyme A synthetase/AMP-(fatty) acid ligase